MGIKLIASDLDGTFLNDEKEISERNRTAVLQAINQGIWFVPATGRSFMAVPETVREFPGVEYVITGNGSAVYSVSKQKCIYRCGIAPESIDKILALPRSEKMTMEIFVEGIPYTEPRYVADPAWFGATGFGVKYVKATRHPVENLEQFIKDHRECIDSMSFVCAEEGLRDEMKQQLREQVLDIFITSAVSHLIEIGHRDAGKGNTLGKLLEILGIRSEEAMACGDADNDVEMLQAVKYGIAMANGTPACLKAAYWISDTNQKDGVAKAIEKYCLMGKKI